MHICWCICILIDDIQFYKHVLKKLTEENETFCGKIEKNVGNEIRIKKYIDIYIGIHTYS
jgi:hypothetical protein